MEKNDPLLTRSQAAEALTEEGLPIQAQTLARLAVEGSGPPYRIWGRRPIYALSDLHTWADSRLGLAAESTSKHHSFRRSRL